MRRRWAFWPIVAVLVLYTGILAGRLLPRASGAELGAGTAACFAAMLAWLLAYHARPRLAAAAWFRAAAWAGAAVMGVWATFVLLSLPADAARLTERGWAVLLGASVLLAAAGLAQVLRGPRVREVDVPVAGLPDALAGLRIVQLSDLHVGLSIRRRAVAEIVRRALALAPDLVAVTGDLADGEPALLRDALSPLAELKAPLGVFFATGNHDYYWGAPRWLDAVRSFGWTPLIDESRVLERGGARLQVAGVCDPQGRAFVPEHRGVVPPADPSAALRVLLAHRPDAARAAAAAGYDLQLSGHTHGGQFFPFSLVVRLVHRHVRGLSREGRLRVYVNPGTGWWGPPHRLGVPAEITLLRLVRAP
ncbi:MAG: metallophosphoesterase [Elusimicrobia bacterium]|nr:metallophosphoesterase [Elusimicrobiota bacterium]